MKDDNARIDELIRSLRRDRGPVEVNVPDEVVHAYLTGRATAAEKSEVRQALIASPQFREEIVQLSSYLETLTSDAAAEAYDRAVAPAYEAATAPKAEVISLWDRVTATVDRFFAIPQLRVAAPVAAAAALVLAVAPWRMAWSPLPGPAASTRVESSEFAVLQGRPRGEGFTDHAEAARSAFHRHFLFRDEAVEFVPPTTEVTGQELATVQLVGRWRRKLVLVTVPADTRAPLPVADREGLDAMVWLALLPAAGGDNVEIRSYKLTGTTLAVRWDDSERVLGAVVVTYEVAGRFHASACVPVELAR